MKSYKIANVGSFMTQLLTSECFDSFLLEEASIHMAATYRIDGRRNPEFASEDSYSYIPWSEIRGICREMIKGSVAPTAFQFTLRLKPQYVADTLRSCDSADTAQCVGSLAINIRLADNGLHIITGIAMQEFTMDKSAERIWDHTVDRFLNSKGVVFEEDV